MPKQKYNTVIKIVLFISNELDNVDDTVNRIKHNNPEHNRKIIIRR